nr:MAG TPA: hypothetical protein [Caudoviricetes sp.]
MPLLRFERYYILSKTNSICQKYVLLLTDC